jgi:small subunit ribosomal protein S1
MNDIHKSLNGDLAADKISQELDKELAEALGEGSIEDMMEQAANANAAPQQDDDSQDGESTQPAATTTRGKSSGGKGSGGQVAMRTRRGRIQSISGDDVFVQLHGAEQHLQAVVPLVQFDRPPRVGSIMDFVISRVNEAEGLMYLAREGAASAATWDHIQKGSIIEARVVSSNKGGLELEMPGNIKAFMPASQIDVNHTDDIDTWIGQKIKAVVHDIDRRGKKMVVSRRRFLEQEKARLEEVTWEKLSEGDTVEGKVERLMPYGAFINIGGVDGLLHIADMSHARINKPEDLVQIGQTLTVKIISMDKDTKKVRLGLKQIQADPWDSIQGRLHIGDHITGVVTRIADFGAFIMLEEGVEALLPVSEMSWNRRVRPEDVVQQGQTVRVNVLSMDLDKRRISVSLKAEQGDPWTGAEVKFAKNSIVDATVKSITDFGAFAQLEPGVEGLVHISELSNRRVNTVEDVLKIGDKKQFRVLECDEENRKIRLSLKQVEEPSAEVQTPVEAPKKARPKFNFPLKGGIE